MISAPAFHAGLEVIFGSMPVSALCQGQRRMEGESYLTGGFGVRRAVDSLAGVESLRSLADIWMPGRLKGTMVKREQGTPFLTASQAFDTSPSPRKWLSPEKTADVSGRMVEPGWILVACSGTNNVGDVTLSHKAHAGIILSHDLLRLRAHNPSDIGRLYTYLKSKYGHAMLRSIQYGSVIKHLEPEHLFDLPIPELPIAVCESTSGRVGECFRLRDEALALVKSAESILSTAIGQMPDRESMEVGYGVPVSSMSIGKRRMDGYFYNPNAASILGAIRASGKKLVPLGSVTEDVYLPNRFTREPASGGIPFLGTEELFQANPRIDKFIRDVPAKLSPYYVKKGWVLVARSGQIYGLFGTSTMTSQWHENKVVSEHLIRVIPSGKSSDPRPGYIQLALNHPIYGRPLVLRTAFGTSIPELSPGDLKDFPLVRLSSSMENSIADKVERASDFRSQADTLENAAVKEMEMAVEALLGDSVAGIAQKEKMKAEYKPTRKRA